MKEREINDIKLRLLIFFWITISILVLIWELLWITMDIDYLWIIIFISAIFIMVATYEMYRIYEFNIFYYIAKILLIFAFWYVSIILFWEIFNDKLDLILPLAFIYHIPSSIITFFSLFNKEKFIILLIFNLLFPIYYFLILFNITPFHLF